MTRFFRCQNEACRRKWHYISIAGGVPKPRTDLLDAARPQTEPACPSCWGPLLPEAGLMEEADADPS